MLTSHGPSTMSARPNGVLTAKLVAEKLITAGLVVRKELFDSLLTTAVTSS